jgi:hypothetical protein
MTTLYIFGWAVSQETLAQWGILIAGIAAGSSFIAGLYAYADRLHRHKAESDRIEVKFPNGRVLSLSRNMSEGDIEGNLHAIHSQLAFFEEGTRSASRAAAVGKEL